MAAHREALIAALLLAGACTSPPPPAATPRPQRIISLIPAVTETLFAIGAGPQVAGVGSYDTYPPEIRNLPRVGGLIDPDTERILSLRPDLAFVYASQETLITPLRAAGVPIEIYRHGGLEGALTSIQSIGARVGHAPEAERIVADIRKTIDGVRARTLHRPKPSVLVIFGREEGTLRGIYASGGTGFIHDMVAAAGGRNVFEDVPRESVQASLESIIGRAPDIVLEIRAPVAERPMRPEDLVAPWSGAPSLPAVRHKRVHGLIDERLVVPGPRIGDAVLVLEAAIAK
jgi:iron complex transport system substrate-binding protein